MRCGRREENPAAHSEMRGPHKSPCAAAQVLQLPGQLQQLGIGEVAVYSQHAGQPVEYAEVGEQVVMGDLEHDRTDQGLLPQDPPFLIQRGITRIQECGCAAKMLGT